VHTDYSDGRSTLEEMVEGAASLGYEYVALIDHSPSARVAHGLSEERLEEKIEAIERVRRQRRGLKPRILMGAEVDILSNGKLDYRDETLARLDVVVASVHGAFRQSRDRMTGRFLDAISNPYVQIIGHPTTRLIGGREAINFDFDKILRAVIDANVAFEIDSQPDRLDLTDTLVRAANQEGALFAINSDAHSLSQLEYIRYGIFDARRGWTEARSVINSWTWIKLSRWLEKRRG
jgi:DNA polymerase (family 10)